MGNSVVIKWTKTKTASEEMDNEQSIKGYLIYVDGQIHQTVLGAGRSKALVSDLMLDKVSPCILFVYVLQSLLF